MSIGLRPEPQQVKIRCHPRTNPVHTISQILSTLWYALAVSPP